MRKYEKQGNIGHITRVKHLKANQISLTGQICTLFWFIICQGKQKTHQNKSTQLINNPYLITNNKGIIHMEIIFNYYW